ncbi:MAG TPA: hypothetical protein VGF23_08990 [Gaiellaceae bacterium]|jgi:hypothetical protein
MATWIWVIIAIAAVLVVAAVLWQAFARRRTAQLRGRFGPEYDRTVDERDGRRAAEADLRSRVERRQELDIQPLAPATRERYARSWDIVQTEFVDDPSGAIAGADRLVSSVMSDRGYPMDDFDQRAADVSVDHPHVVEHYHAAHEIALASHGGNATTEQLRRGMQHYRALFEELLGPAADEPLARDPADAPVARAEQPEEVRRR